MNKSVIIESSQQQATNNYLVDYASVDANNNMKHDIKAHKWKTRLPYQIKLEVGDTIELSSAMIKSKGLSDESVELIGTAENIDITDNKIRLETGYWIGNNWQNNLMLPLGIATLKNYVPNKTAGKWRDADFENNVNIYNVNGYDSITGFTNIPTCWWSDYGAPSVETPPGPMESYEWWYVNGAGVLTDNYATQPVLGWMSDAKTNRMCCGNLCYYRPDEQRLYQGPDDWLGPYSHGYNTTYHNLPMVEGDVNFEIKKTNADIETNIGFNSPIVIAQKITEELANPQQDEFIKPYAMTNQTGYTTGMPSPTYKNYWVKEDLTQYTDATIKVQPTTYGKMYYDLNEGKVNFSPTKPLNTATGIAYPTLPQKAKYLWNCMCSGDYKRTNAITKLYENLYKAKNVDTLNVLNLEDASFYSGSILPNTLWAPEFDIEVSPAYPISQPRDFGEQMVLFDDLTSFSEVIDADERLKQSSNLIYRGDYQEGYIHTPGERPPRIGATEKVLNIQPNNVIMTNMIANEENINKMLEVRDLLERPSDNTEKINYNSQAFKDTLYYPLELGRLDDQYSISADQIEGGYVSVAEYTEPIGSGISFPVALACVKSVSDKNIDIVANYTKFGGIDRLPIYAGLFCNDDEITEKIELKLGSVANDKSYTLLGEWRDNKMYEIDCFSRYNADRTPQSGNLTLPLLPAPAPPAPPQPSPLSNFSFKNTDGEYFDDSKIKDNDLGLVVAYRQLKEVGAQILEFGLGNIPSLSQFTSYSLDTTTPSPNYLKNDGTGGQPSVYINYFVDKGLNVLCDNSVSNGAGATQNATCYFTQNSVDGIWNDTTNKVVISTAAAPTIEYDAGHLITPAQVEMFQEATYPLVGTPPAAQIFGGSVGLGSNSVLDDLATAEWMVYDNLVADTGNYSYWYNAGANYPFYYGVETSSPKTLTRFRMWITGPTWSGNNYHPTSFKIDGAVSAAEFALGNFETLYTSPTGLTPGAVSPSGYNNGAIPVVAVAPLSATTINACFDAVISPPASGTPYSYFRWQQLTGYNGYKVITQIILDAEPETQISRFPKQYIMQGKRNTDDDWIHIRTTTPLTTAPFPAGYEPVGPVYPDDPPIATLTPPTSEIINSGLAEYRYFRWIFTDVFSGISNSLALGEMTFYKNNQTEVVFGDDNLDFDTTKLKFAAVNPATPHTPIPGTYANVNPLDSHRRIFGQGLPIPPGASFSVSNLKIGNKMLGAGISLATAGATITGTPALAGTSVDKLYDNTLPNHTDGWHADTGQSWPFFLRTEFTTGFFLRTLVLFARVNLQTQMPGKYNLWAGNTTGGFGDLTGLVKIIENATITIAPDYNNPVYSGTSASANLNQAFYFNVPEANRGNYKTYTLEILENSYSNPAAQPESFTCICEMAFYEELPSNYATTATISAFTNVSNATDNGLTYPLHTSQLDNNFVHINLEAAPCITYDNGTQTPLTQLKIWWAYYIDESTRPVETFNLPSCWEIQGSTDNVNWTTIDNTLRWAIEGATSTPETPTDENAHILTFPETDPYRYVRILFYRTGHSAGRDIEIGEIALYNNAAIGWNIQNGLLDYSLNECCQLSMNTTQTYGAADAVNLVGGVNAFTIEYEFATEILLSHMAIWPAYTALAGVSELCPDAPIRLFISEGGSIWVEVDIEGDIGPDQFAVSADIDTSSAYINGKLQVGTQKCKFMKLMFEANYAPNNTTNFLLIPNLMISKFASANTLIQDVPFLGIVAREQISSVGKYKIPLPIEGEFFGLSPSLQNNSLSYTFSNSKVVEYQNWNNRNSWLNDQKNMPYMLIGAGDATCEYDTANSRMSFSKLHSLYKEGQATNNMLRSYEATQVYNDPSAHPLVVPDSEAASEVVKYNRRRSEVNSARAGFTEQIPTATEVLQVYPISNKFIRQKGACSATSGIGILSVSAAKIDGTYQILNPLNDFTYRGTLLDKLGFDLRQISPLFGQQNTLFNRGSHNKYLQDDEGALNIYNNCVYPVSTNAFIGGAVNTALDTNNLNFGMGGLNPNNTLEKSIPQTSDALIGLNLPQKFSYSHLLVYSNVIPKFNYIGGSNINKLPCIGLINRSYQTGDFIYLNETATSYEVDLNYNLSEIDIDIRQSNGLPAPISFGSTIVLKINKKKPVPLLQQEEMQKLKK